MDSPLLHSDHWRLRPDNGEESSDSWYELEDVAHDFPTGELDVNLRIRFSVHITIAAKVNVNWQLERNLNGGSFAVVDGASTIARSSLSGNFADGDDTTQHGVTFVQDGIYITNNDCMDDVDGLAGSGNNDLAIDDFEAVEFCVQLREADLADNDIVRFRITEEDGTPLTTEVLAVCTIDLAAGGGLPIPVAMASYRRQHERGR